MLVSRSATICEIDTFMTLLSSTITNCADARMAMGSHLRISEVCRAGRPRGVQRPSVSVTVRDHAPAVPSRRRGQLPRPAAPGTLVVPLSDAAGDGRADHAAAQPAADADRVLRR